MNHKDDMMARWMRVSWFAIALAICPFYGCNKPDSTSYHQVTKQDQKSDPATTTDKSDSDNDAASTAVVNAYATNSADTPANENALTPVSALVPVNVVDGNNVKGLMSIPDSDLKNASGSAGDKSSSAEAAEPRQIEVLVKEKTFRSDPKTGAQRVSFDDLDLLKVLNMEPVVVNAKELMPEWLQGLDGKTVRLRGFMYPTYDTEGIEHFVLARDNQICCFGRDPKIYDLVQVDMKPGKTTNYIPATRAFDVVGKFKIDMLAEDGKPYGLYVLEQADVIDK